MQDHRQQVKQVCHVTVMQISVLIQQPGLVRMLLNTKQLINQLIGIDSW